MTRQRQGAHVDCVVEEIEIPGDEDYIVVRCSVLEREQWISKCLIPVNGDGFRVAVGYLDEACEHKHRDIATGLTGRSSSAFNRECWRRAWRAMSATEKHTRRSDVAAFVWHERRERETRRKSVG